MKTFIVYVNGTEVGFLKAANHNSAEKKAKNKYGTVNHDEAVRFQQLHPCLTHQEARDILIDRLTNVSVAYTEI